jgi:two-component system response regulator DevR
MKPAADGSRPITVFLLDDHEIVRRGLADLLECDPEITIVGEAASISQALARIPALRPDVAVLDFQLPDGSGADLCRELLARLPDLHCLIMTSYTSEQVMLDAIFAGASGFVVKDIRGLELTQAIKDVAAGRSRLDTHAAAALIANLRRAAEPTTDPLKGLSELERTLLELLGQGLTNQQIAVQTCLAEKTVKNYVSRLLNKLGMQRRAQAAGFAARMQSGS